MMENRVKRSLVGGILLLVAMALVPLGTANSQESSSVRSQESPVLVTAEWVSQRMGDLVLVNVDRNDEGFGEVHIPGARFVALSEFVSNESPGAEMKSAVEMAEAFARAGVSLDRDVVLYGAQTSAARAFVTLEFLGHERAHVLDGGLQAWKDAGYETESGPQSEVRPGHFVPDVQPEIVVTSEWMMDNLRTPGITVIDARTDDEYRGVGDYGAERGLKPGHVPGANLLNYRDLIRSPEDARFLDLDGLVDRFQAAHASPGETLVSYCVSGMRASVTYLISRHLGFDAKLYDGSWRDWSSKELPVVAGSEPGGN
jgi:thiosulfate/3-mercaptopyruvate sulfurtransferase